MRFDSKSMLVHELKHGHQFELGEISFNNINGKAGYLHDLNDERAAYNAESAYSGNLLIRNLSNKDIKSRADSYFTLSKQPLNVDSKLGDVLSDKKWKQYFRDNKMAKKFLFKDNAQLLGDIIINR